MISTLTFLLPSERFHSGFPLKSKAAKACCRVVGNSNLFAMLVDLLFLLRRSVLKCDDSYILNSLSYLNLIWIYMSHCMTSLLKLEITV